VAEKQAYMDGNNPQTEEDLKENPPKSISEMEPLPHDTTLAKNKAMEVQHVMESQRVFEEPMKEPLQAPLDVGQKAHGFTGDPDPDGTIIGLDSLVCDSDDESDWEPTAPGRSRPNSAVPQSNCISDGPETWGSLTQMYNNGAAVEAYPEQHWPCSMNEAETAGSEFNCALPEQECSENESRLNDDTLLLETTVQDSVKESVAEDFPRTDDTHLETACQTSIINGLVDADSKTIEDHLVAETTME